MAAKLDKETLIKHRFWFLLPVVVLLWLFAFISISTVRSTTEKNWKEAEGVNKELKAIPTQDLKNTRWIEAMKKKKAAAEDQKLDLWYDVFDKQNSVVREQPPAPASEEGPRPRGKTAAIRAPLITWPRSTRDEIAIAVRGKDFGAPLGNVPNEFKDVFLRQYEDLVKIVDPLNDKTGEGAMRFGTQGDTPLTQGLMLLKPLDRLVEPSRSPWGERPVLSEEAWLAQEEFAIKRDMFHIVREINGVLGDLTPVWREVGLPTLPPASADPANSAPQVPPAAEEAKPADAVKTLDRKRFLNTTWQFGVKTIKEPETEWYMGWLLELELTAKGNDLILEGTSTNLSLVNALPQIPVAVYLSSDDPRDTRDYAIVIDAGKLSPTKIDPDRLDPAKKLLPQPSLELAAKLAKDIKDYKGSSQAVSVPLSAIAKKYNVPLSRFKKIARMGVPPGEGVLDHQRFTNNNWVVEVELVPRADSAGQVRGVVYNKSGRRVLPVGFKVVTADVRGAEFAAEIKLPQGTAFDANTFKPFPLQALSEGTPVRIAAVRQALDWRTVPVKQINRLEMGQVAHLPSVRSAAKFTLKAYNFALKSGGAAEPTPAAPPTTPQAPAPGTGTGDGLAAPTSSLAAGSTPNHGIVKARYAEVTKELRRIPVAMVLVVDQAHINDAILAFSNSKLRIQTTLVVWNRVPGLPRPAFIAAPAAKPGDAPVIPGAASRGGPIAEESNLVELQLYGLATIYEDPERAPGAAAGTPVAGQ